jgi:hypothetical protein
LLRKAREKPSEYSFNIRLFTSELYFDFKDYEKPLKYRIKVISDDMIQAGNFSSLKGGYSTRLSINDVSTIDNPIVNPYKDKYDLQKTYLTLDEVTPMKETSLPYFFVGV